jgi:hypothetical protein
VAREYRPGPGGIDFGRGSKKRIAKLTRDELGSRDMWLMVAFAIGTITLFFFLHWCQCV